MNISNSLSQSSNSNNQRIPERVNNKVKSLYDKLAPRESLTRYVISEVIPDIAPTVVATVVCGSTFIVATSINWALGHYWAQYMDGPERHERVHERHSVCYVVLTESCIGVIPSAAILVATALTIHGIQLSHAKLKNYYDRWDTWKKQENEFVTLEEIKLL